MSIFTKDKAKTFVKNWIKQNIYDNRKGDGVAYFVLYLCIPIIITIISLFTVSKDDISIAYCYVTIMISALNSIYDSANRWSSDKSKSVKNIKLLIMILCNSVITIYCLSVFFYVLISENSSDMCRCDGILMIYFVVVAIALVDMFTCFIRDISIQECIKEEMR